MGAADIGDPQSLNLYAYCGNDPINHTDPDGLFFKKLFGGLRKFLSNIFVRIALVVALAIITIGASSSLWALTYKTLVEVQLGGHAIGTTATVISIEVTKLTTLGWIAAGLGAVTGASLGIGGAGFRTPPTFETGLLATQRGGGRRGGGSGRRGDANRPSGWGGIIWDLVRGPATRRAARARFPNSLDHARRHPFYGATTREDYVNVARRHMEIADGSFLVKYPNGQHRWNFVTRIGRDEFIFTSTSANRNVIFTTYIASGQTIRNMGINVITYPPDFVGPIPMRIP
jgi:hypothetical protein